MKIVQALPPIYDEAAKVFDIPKTAVFAYGDTLYNPAGGNISADLMEHEQTHQKQQAEMGVTVWWNRYLHNADFRLSQEIEAYKAQYKYFCQQYTDRNVRMRFLNRIASDLASPMYKVNISLQEARGRIGL